MQLCGFAITEIAEEVGADRGAGEECRIDLGVVEPRHRPAVETERAGGKDEVGALQRTVAERGRLDQRLVADEPGAGVGGRFVEQAAATSATAPAESQRGMGKGELSLS